MLWPAVRSAGSVNFGAATVRRETSETGTWGISNSLALASGGAYVPYDDESKGFEIQALWVPVDGLQLRLGYSYLDNRVTSRRYEFAAFPEPNDQAEFGKWAYPAENWGTFGLQSDRAFADPNDPSTSLLEPIEAGGPIDDTPAHIATWWAKYSFMTDVLKGWSFGLGGSYQSSRLYNDGALAGGIGFGQRDETGRFAIQREYTQARWRWNGLIEYRFIVLDRYRTRIALNVDNLADDKALYGYVYAPGRSANLSVGVNF